MEEKRENKTYVKPKCNKQWKLIKYVNRDMVSFNSKVTLHRKHISLYFESSLKRSYWELTMEKVPDHFSPMMEVNCNCELANLCDRLRIQTFNVSL